MKEMNSDNESWKTLVMVARYVKDEMKWNVQEKVMVYKHQITTHYGTCTWTRDTDICQQETFKNKLKQLRCQ